METQFLLNFHNALFMGYSFYFSVTYLHLKNHDNRSIRLSIPPDPILLSQYTAGTAFEEEHLFFCTCFSYEPMKIESIINEAAC